MSADASGDGAESTGRTMTLFRVRRTREAPDDLSNDHVIGWGVQFPSGSCYVDWNRQAWAPKDRLKYPHVSEYGSLEDVRQGTGGVLDMLETIEVVGGPTDE